MEPIGPGGEAVLDFAVYDAKRAGFGKVIFVIRREMDGEFREMFGRRLAKHISVDYAFQELDMVPAGTEVDPVDPAAPVAPASAGRRKFFGIVSAG